MIKHTDPDTLHAPFPFPGGPPALGPPFLDRGRIHYSHFSQYSPPLGLTPDVTYTATPGGHVLHVPEPRKPEPPKRSTLIGGSHSPGSGSDEARSPRRRDESGDRESENQRNYSIDKNGHNKQLGTTQASDNTGISLKAD